MKKKLFLSMVVLTIGAITHAMNTEVQLPSAEILTQYLSNNIRLPFLNEEICQNFSDQKTSPVKLLDFINDKITERSGGMVYTSIGKDINTVVKLTFQDYPEILKEAYETPSEESWFVEF